GLPRVAEIAAGARSLSSERISVAAEPGARQVAVGGALAIEANKLGCGVPKDVRAFPVTQTPRRPVSAVTDCGDAAPVVGVGGANTVIARGIRVNVAGVWATISPSALITRLFLVRISNSRPRNARTCERPRSRPDLSGKRRGSSCHQC